MSASSIAGTRSFEEGGDSCTDVCARTQKGQPSVFNRYAGTLVGTGITVALAGYALKGSSGVLKRGAALVGSTLGAIITQGVYEDESCTGSWR